MTPIMLAHTYVDAPTTGDITRAATNSNTITQNPATNAITKRRYGSGIISRFIRVL